MVNQHHDREGDTDAALEIGEIMEDETKQGRDDEIFEDSVSDTATDDPSDTGDQVFPSLSIEELDIDARQPVDLEHEKEV